MTRHPIEEGRSGAVKHEFFDYAWDDFCSRDSHTGELDAGRLMKLPINPRRVQWTTC